MDVFDLLGYRSDKPYSIDSKTSVGQFVLVAPTAAPSKVFLGSTNITSIYYGSTPVVSIYYGSTKVFG